jgi:FlaA1/EpsC-like NDP-sugar epimerase
MGLPVFFEDDSLLAKLREMGIVEIVFAIPNVHEDSKKRQYNLYLQAGFKIKAYDFPVMHSAGGKRHLRDFDIEELLFRKPVRVNDDATTDYYRDRVILITGGGGSIGSELCRQLAKMHPRQIILLDVYENGA